MTPHSLSLTTNDLDIGFTEQALLTIEKWLIIDLVLATPPTRIAVAQKVASKFLVFIEFLTTLNGKVQWDNQNSPRNQRID